MPLKKMKTNEKISAIDFLMSKSLAPKAPVRQKKVFVSFHLKRNSLPRQ